MQQIIIEQRENVKNLESIGLFEKISTLCFCFERMGYTTAARKADRHRVK